MAGHSETAPSDVLAKHSRLVFCERMGWTFEQYDSAKAGDILFARKIWKIRNDLKGS